MNEPNEESIGFIKIVKIIFMHLINPTVNSMDIWD